MSEKEVIGQVTLKNVRLGFPFLFDRGAPTKNDDGEEREGNFRASFIMYKSGIYKPYTDNNLKLLKQARNAVSAAKWGTDEKKWPKIKPEKICVRNGDLENWDGFQDSFYCAASESTQPVLLSRRKDEKGLWIPATRAELFAGCFVNAIVALWIQDNKHGLRVNANLKAVQFYKAGEHFAGSAPIDPSKAFMDVDEDEEDAFGGGGFNGGDDDDDDVV